MADLGTELFDRVVSLLVPFMGTEDDRKTELYPVVQGRPINDSIQWEGKPKQFTVQLVHLLPYDLLLVVLRRLSVGEEKRPAIAEICAAIEQQQASVIAAMPTVAVQPARRAELEESLVLRSPKRFMTEAKRTELWATLDRVRQEPHVEFGPALRTETTERTVVVRRPDAIVTEVATLVNVSNEAQGRCKFGLFTDSPTQFKDMNLRVQAKIGDVAFEPAVSHTSEGGLKFMIELGFRGNIVKPGGRIKLQYTARYPSSVALNEDYWVFTAETMRPGAHCEISVKFPNEPADIACYQISMEGKREHIPVSGPYKERQEGIAEELSVYRVTPDNPGGNSFVMTWRLENEL